jgi:hypothetical protein
MYKTRSIFRLKTEEKKRQKCEVHNMETKDQNSNTSRACSNLTTSKNVRIMHTYFIFWEFEKSLRSKY